MRHLSCACRPSLLYLKIEKKRNYANSFSCPEVKENPERKEMSIANTAVHPRNPSVDIKINAFHRCFEPGESSGAIRYQTITRQVKDLQMEIDILKETINIALCAVRINIEMLEKK